MIGSMNARISYLMAYGPNPFSQHKPVEKAWVLWRVTTPELGTSDHHEPVAVFNRDSDATEFQGHVVTEGLDGRLVRVDRQLRASLEELRELRKARGGE